MANWRCARHKMKMFMRDELQINDIDNIKYFVVSYQDEFIFVGKTWEYRTEIEFQNERYYIKHDIEGATYIFDKEKAHDSFLGIVKTTKVKYDKQQTCDFNNLFNPELKSYLVLNDNEYKVIRDAEIKAIEKKKEAYIATLPICRKCTYFHIVKYYGFRCNCESPKKGLDQNGCCSEFVDHNDLTSSGGYRYQFFIDRLFGQTHRLPVK